MGNEKKIRYIEEYTLDQQVEELSKATRIAKADIRRVLRQQRKLMQIKLSLGYKVSLKGVFDAEPKEKGDSLILTAKVAQTVPRPHTIRYKEMWEKTEDKWLENNITDEDLE